MIDLNWWLHVFVLAGLAAGAWYTVGSRAAIGIVLFASFLIPSWFKAEIFGFPMSVRTAAALIGLLGYLLDRKAKYNFRLTPIDLFMLMLVATHLISDTIKSGFSIALILRIYGEWFVPYVCGRLAIQSISDMKPLRLTATIVLIVLIALAGVEAISQVNPYEMFYGLRPMELSPRLQIRWFFRRAYGPMMHTIFLGLVMNLLLPWSLFGTTRGADRRTNSDTPWWLFGLTGVGTVFTGSRAAVIGIPGQLAIAFWGVFRQARIPMIVLGVVLAAVGVYQWKSVVRKVEEVGWEARVQNGEVRATTGTTARLELISAYSFAVFEGGLFGHGTEAVKTFPVNVPMRDMSEERRLQMRFVDNHYLLITLRFGYLGLIAFCGVLFFSLAAWLPLLKSIDRQQRWAAGVMVGSLGMMTLQLATIWLSFDYGLFLLFVFGASSGIALDRASMQTPIPTKLVTRRSRRLKYQPS